MTAMSELIHFLFIENLMLSVITLLCGAMAAYYWSKPADASLVEPLSAIQILNSSQGLYLDVRTGAEFEKGHIVNSKNIPLSELEGRLESIRKYKSKPVIVVCERGTQAPTAKKKLGADGFENVFLLKGGLGNWRTNNLPLSRK